MRFWDASALIPLMVRETQAPLAERIAAEDGDLVVWWGSSVECLQALGRRRRDGTLTSHEEDRVRDQLDLLSSTWTEIQPVATVRETAGNLALKHPLRAADAFQLAAALLWTKNSPRGFSFVSFDDRLRTAARDEGFTVLP